MIKKSPIHGMALSMLYFLEYIHCRPILEGQSIVCTSFTITCFDSINCFTKGYQLFYYEVLGVHMMKHDHTIPTLLENTYSAN